MAKNDFRERYGPWALIAGASQGIGAEFARQLAQRGLNLVMVARRPGPLNEIAQEIADGHGVQVRPVALDLSRDDLVTLLRQHTDDVAVGLVVHNAALSLIGPFLEQSLSDKLRIIDVNCRAPVRLIDHYAPAMVERGRGGIILMSSLSGYQGSPWISTYAASKAFDLVLGEGLWGELGRQGVDVLAYAAGATRTPSFEESKPRSTSFLSSPMEPAPVVAGALATLGRKPSGVPGRTNRIACFVMSRLLPRRTAVKKIGQTTRAMYLRDVVRGP